MKNYRFILYVLFLAVFAVIILGCKPKGNPEEWEDITSFEQFLGTWVSLADEDLSSTGDSGAVFKIGLEITKDEAVQLAIFDFSSSQEVKSMWSEFSEFFIQDFTENDEFDNVEVDNKNYRIVAKSETLSFEEFEEYLLTEITLQINGNKTKLKFKENNEEFSDMDLILIKEN